MGTWEAAGARIEMPVLRSYGLVNVCAKRRDPIAGRIVAAIANPAEASRDYGELGSGFDDYPNPSFNEVVIPVEFSIAVPFTG